jgi:ribosome-associated toxin RatA of RatAB toxin-antitoxin module
MTRFFFSLLFLLGPSAVHAEPLSPQPVVEANADRVHRDGQSFFSIQASGFVFAAPQQAWGVLTDYDRLDEFVPDLQSSRLITRSAHHAVVEQRSEAGFLFISHTIHLVVSITEQPFSSIDVALVSGDMQRYTGHWQLAPATRDGVQGTLVSYTGTMEPDFFVPPLVGTSAVQANVRKMVAAVVQEIDRRSMH